MHRLPWCDACAPRWIIFGAVHANSCLAVNADATHQSISGCDIGALGRRFRVLGCVCEAPAAGRACRGYVRCLWRRLPASCAFMCCCWPTGSMCVMLGQGTTWKAATAMLKVCTRPLYMACGLLRGCSSFTPHRACSAIGFAGQDQARHCGGHIRARAAAAAGGARASRAVV